MIDPIHHTEPIRVTQILKNHEDHVFSPTSLKLLAYF